MVQGVILDADSLGSEIDLSPVTDLLDNWQVYPFTRPEETAARLTGATVALSNKIGINGDHLAQAGNLRYISVLATGTNNIDLEAAHAHGIQVSNARGYATPSVVQHTISLILMLSTNLHRYLADVQAGHWQAASVFCLLDHPIQEIRGRQLGIVGHGELGSHVARAAAALGMQVVLSERPHQPVRPGRMDFNKMLETSDYVSLHCPLTDETTKLIDNVALSRMKASAFLINTARGGLIDSSALIEALKTGQLAGAAIDVLNREPPAQDEPLLAGVPNLLVTPHNAWGAIESRTRLVAQMKENIEGFLAGHPPRLVNP